MLYFTIKSQSIKHFILIIVITMAVEKIYTQNAPEPIGPYSQAVRIRDENPYFIYTSGQIPIDPKTGNVVEGGIKQQTTQVMKNISEILKSSGSSLKNVFKTTVFLKDMDNFASMNEIYAEYFGESKPARSTVEVARLPKDVLVEIEVIAYM